VGLKVGVTTLTANGEKQFGEVSVIKRRKKKKKKTKKESAERNISHKHENTLDEIFNTAFSSPGTKPIV